MADIMALSHVTTNELLHCGRTHSESTRGSRRSRYHRARGRASRYVCCILHYPLSYEVTVT